MGDRKQCGTMVGYRTEEQIQDFVTTARKAQDADYDGVEIMGSEGYFINEFLDIADFIHCVIKEETTVSFNPLSNSLL